MRSHRTTVVVTLICAGVGAVLGLGASLGAVVVGVGALSVATVIASRFGVEALIEAGLAANALLVPMNGLRLGPLMTVSDAVLLSVAPLLLVTRLSGVKPQKAFLRSCWPFTGALAVMAFGGLVATALSPEPFHGIPGLVRFMLSTIVVVLLFALWGPPEHRLRRIVWAYVIGAVLSVLVGLVQDTTFYSGRSYGLATHPNHLGMTSLLGCGAAIAIAATSRGILRTAALVALALLVGGVVSSGSRAALLGVVVLFAAFLTAVRNWRLLRLAALLVAVIAVGAVVGSSRLPSVNAVGRLFTSDRQVRASDEERREALQSTVERIRERPLTGSGFEFALEAHSLYLQLWTSAGLIGLAGLVLLFFRTGRLVVTGRDDSFSTALMSAFLAYLTIGVFSNILWDRYVWTLLAAGVTAAALARRRQQISVGRLLVPVGNRV